MLEQSYGYEVAVVDILLLNSKKFAPLLLHQEPGLGAAKIFLEPCLAQFLSPD
jgi:hypothetical protein